jgi:hypothetical protein
MILMGYSVEYGKVGCLRGGWGVSPQAELARRVLNLLADGQQLSAAEATQLRMWAVRPEDTFLPLEDIANGILNEESGPNKSASGDSSDGKKSNLSD